VNGAGITNLMQEVVAWRTEPPTVQISLRGVPASVSAARRFVADALPGCPRADDLILAASELASNAVCHSASGEGGRFTLRVRTVPRWARVEVTDAGPAVSRPRSATGGGCGSSARSPTDQERPSAPMDAAPAGLRSPGRRPDGLDGREIRELQEIAPSPPETRQLRPRRSASHASTTPGRDICNRQVPGLMAGGGSAALVPGVPVVAHGGEAPPVADIPAAVAGVTAVPALLPTTWHVVLDLRSCGLGQLRRPVAHSIAELGSGRGHQPGRLRLDRAGGLLHRRVVREGPSGLLQLLVALPARACSHDKPDRKAGEKADPVLMHLDLSRDISSRALGSC
jgi:hypothetical protein